MDIEFHYYMTYLIAARAGLPAEEALLIAHASQFVDDNTIRLRIEGDPAGPYESYISQTMDVTRPEAKLFRVYACFHFLPGDPTAQTAWRKDGAMSWLNTTPDSDNAKAMMRAALDTGDPYRIGIACHTYADTWAHQNFLGFWDDFNAMGSFDTLRPNVGHGDAAHSPDWPGLIWTDPRLIQGEIDNRDRFMEAARHLYRHLRAHADGAARPVEDAAAEHALEKDLRQAIGDEDPRNMRRGARIEAYRDLAATSEYGATPLPEYDADVWIDACLDTPLDILLQERTILGVTFRLADILPTPCRWLDRDGYRDTDWWKFQQAVRGHQADVLTLLRNDSLHGLELPNF